MYESRDHITVKYRSGLMVNIGRFEKDIRLEYLNNSEGDPAENQKYLKKEIDKLFSPYFCDRVCESWVSLDKRKIHCMTFEKPDKNTMNKIYLELLEKLINREETESVFEEQRDIPHGNQIQT